MTTFSQMVDDTILYLSGFVQIQEQSTHLTAGIDDNDLALPVNDGTAISRGLIEIDSELIWVDSASASSATIPPYGRGFRGTTAASHSSGARVTSSPLFPRQLVKNAINETIDAVYPNLFGVASTDLTCNPAVSTYALPAGAKEILAVSYEQSGPSREWMPARRWRADVNADTTDFASGVSLSIYDPVEPNRSIRVTYTKQPTLLVNDSDNFSTVTGLPSSSEDVIRLGAAYRMVMFLDTPHLSGLTAEADLASNLRQMNGAVQLSRQVFAMFRQRLEDEALKLKSLYPVRSHYTR